MFVGIEKKNDNGCNNGTQMNMGIWVDWRKKNILQDLS
jgi:hypothetical protein